MRGIIENALFAVGFLFIAAVFGEVKEGTTAAQWATATILNLGIGATCFYALYRILRNH